MLSCQQRPGVLIHSAPAAGTRISRSTRISVRVGVASTEKYNQTAPALITDLQELPPSLRNAVAIVKAPNPSAPGGCTQVYLLGVSHVSKKSCDQVRELIHLVSPEVVVVELCKERLGLLVGEDQPRLDQTWHCRKVTFEGVPSEANWPTPDQLRTLLLTRPGQLVTTGDIEADVDQLLSTGLFGRARPLAESGGRGDAPLFGVVRAEEEEEEGAEEESQAGGEGVGDIELQLVPPLGGVKFIVEERVVPEVTSMDVRLDSSLKGSSVSQEQLEAVAAEVMAAAAAAAAASSKKEEEASSSSSDAEEEDKNKTASSSKNGLGTYLLARTQLAAAFPDPNSIVVEFSGVAEGRVEAVVRARRGSDPPLVTGLEASAEGGEGIGIVPFTPMRNSVQISPSMMLPAEATERLSAARAARQAERVVRMGENWQQRTQVTQWTHEEIASPAELEFPSSPVVDILGRVMTSTYAKLQNKAAAATGTSSGEAWRAAMEAGTEVGAQQVILGDMPANISQRHLASSIIGPAAARLTAALGLLSAGVAAAVNHATTQLLPDVAAATTGAGAAADAAAVALGAAAATAALWPLLGPYVEVWRFGNMSGEEVEEVVDITEPLQANLDKPLLFFGEDALLRWPGAMRPLIEERDAFMARVAAAAATSKPCAAPAFVASTLGSGQLVWRYMAAQEGPAGSSPKGSGDGGYGPLAGPRAVVAVVGSAHVRGMCRQWESSIQKAGDVEELLKV